ncbi:MAG: DMT family transporter [Alcanivorax sp.]
MLSALTTSQKGILSAFCGFTGFAVADACSKWLGATYDTLFILFWVYLISLILGLCFARFLGGIKRTLNTKKLHFHIGRGISALAVGLFVVTALSNGLQLATLYTILFLAPFITTLAAIPIYKEKVPAENWGIIALGFSGIIVAFHDGLNAITPEVMYAFCALFFIVCLGLMARPIDQNESLLSLSFYPSLIIVLCLAFHVIPDIHLPAAAHMPIFILDGIGVLVGLSGIAYGFRIAPYSVVAPVHYSQMVIALMLGYFVFKDIPDFYMMIGAGIIIMSGLLLIAKKGRRKKA